MTSFQRTAIGIGAIGGAVILFEIALTRIFAVAMWHHLTYMVVAIAMLGFGAAGSQLTAAARLPRRPSARLAALACGFAITILAALYLGSAVRLDSLGLFSDARNLAALLLHYGLLGLPMFLGGLVVGTALQVEAERVHRLYFADLLGAALAAAGVVFLLDRLGAVAVLHLAAALAALGAFVFALGAAFLDRLASLVVLGLMLALFAGHAGLGGELGLRRYDWPLEIAPGKEMADRPIERRLPSATAEVEVAAETTMLPIMGGEYDLATARPLPGRFVTQDGTAPTMLYAGAADLERFAFLGDCQAASGYRSWKAQGRESPAVLVVGVGGGIDVMTALHEGAREVTAVEINAAMIRMVTEDYDAYLGGLFTRRDPPFDRVRLVRGEGRAQIRESEKRYDLIQLSGVDSYTALSTGAYTLAESYLYTVEAVQDLHRHLEDGGIITYSRFMLGRPRRPRETLRLAGIAREALEELGVADPAASICVFQGRLWASTMIKKGPFLPAEIEALRRFAEDHGFRGLVFDPLHDPALPFPSELAPAPALALYFRDRIRQELTSVLPAPLDEVAAAIMARSFAEGGPVGGDGLVERMVGLLPPERRSAATAPLADFVGRATAEVAADTEHFRGTRADFQTLLRAAPRERAAFVAAYPYRLDPCRDDAPFFFDYQRWDRFAEALGGKVDLYNADFPVGHGVLLASLVQVGILATILILLPLRSLREQGRPTPRRWRYLAYFAALGLGFMLVEIALMQKLVLLLGHPSHALALVLGGLLGAAGVGSFLAERLGRPGPIKLLLLGLLSTLVIALVAEWIDAVTAGLLGAALPWRLAAALALVALVGLPLGAAFPTGIRLLRLEAPALIPWAWAVNGFTGVIGGLLAVLLAQEVGFRKVLLLAAAVYLLGFLLLPAAGPTADQDEADDADQQHGGGDEDRGGQPLGGITGS
ncbi:MAG: hypothetical protein H6807_10985 [Planctomycetes bacterium]|nr:hypothetical protein [Planctomycetota bacterium]